MKTDEFIKQRNIRRNHKKSLIRDFLSDRDFENVAIASSMRSDKFYKSKRWLDLRYDVLKLQGNHCKACGKGPKKGACIQVDHILPRWIYPELAFDTNNLQILCSDCNSGKGIRDKTKW